MKIHGICSYLGKNYSGWQKQIDFPSIQEEIEIVLSKVLNTETNIQGSGRTDAGVHALNQHFHFEVNKEVDLNRLMYSLNSMLPDDILIKNLIAVDDDFHARFSAKGKEYKYLISKDTKDPFKTDTYWLMPVPFDDQLFEDALKLFVGTHNFKNFTSKEEDEAGFKRKVNIELKTNDNIVTIDFYGNGFMKYMIQRKLI